MFNKILILTMMLAGGAAVAQSTPTKSPNCQDKVRIRAVKNGAGVFFNKDCSVAYVLPPIHGDLKISEPTTPPAADMCAEFNFLEGKVTTIRNEIMKIYKKIAKIRKGSGGGFGGGTLHGNGNDGELSDKDKQKIAALEADIEALEEDLGIEQIKLEAQSERMKGKEGSWLSVLFSWNYADVVAAYQKANPKVRFQRLPLSRATLSFNRRVNLDDERYPAVEFFDVPGISDMRVQTELDAPIGEKIDAVKTEEVSTELKIFGESLGGQMILSLKASCPFYDVKNGKMKRRISKKKLEAYFVANVTYKYYLQAFRRYHAKFNLASLVKRIQKSTKKGGFFSTKTINSLIEEKNSKDWFEITVDSDHNELSFDDISQEVKADLISRAMEQITLMNTGQPSQAPSIVTPPANGASTAAKELQKCPYIYCQAGAAILGVADAIWGSSEAVSNFIKNNNVWSEDRVEERKMFEYHGTSSFDL